MKGRTMLMTGSILRKFESDPGIFDKDGFAISEDVAHLLVALATGISWKLETAAKNLRDMEQGSLVLSDGSVLPAPEAWYGQEFYLVLKQLPERPDWELQNAFRWANEWQKSMEETAQNENWTRVCPMTLMPAKDEDKGPFLLKGSDILNWLQRTSAPSICTAFEDELHRSGSTSNAPPLLQLAQEGITSIPQAPTKTEPEELAGEQAEADRKETGSARTLKPEEQPRDRRERILKRFEVKKAAGSRAPVKELAAEEKLSESTIKQLLNKARKARDNQ